jgi:hypothetical protein
VFSIVFDGRMLSHHFQTKKKLDELLNERLEDA